MSALVTPKQSNTAGSSELASKENWMRATRSKPATSAARNAVARSCSACSSCGRHKALASLENLLAESRGRNTADTQKKESLEVKKQAQCAPHHACFPQQSAAIARARCPAHAALRQPSAMRAPRPHPAAGWRSAGCWGSRTRPDTAPSLTSPRPASAQPSLHAHLCTVL